MLTVSELQKSLKWQAIEEVFYPEYCDFTIYVRPSRAELDSIHFCVSADRLVLSQFGFGNWHYHPDIIDAIEMARLLVCGERCIVEQLDAAGEYCSGGVYLRNEVPTSIGKDVKELRRVFFNREPVTEAIDYEQYFRGKHGLISHKSKAEMEDFYRQHGMPVPEW